MIMCQNRWWLKLFFYLLDVGTSNALILYNESYRIHSNGIGYIPMNIVDFKMQIIKKNLEIYLFTDRTML